MEKLASCCGFRKVKAGMAWSDYRSYVRRLAKLRGVQPNEAQRAKLLELKEQAARERQAFQDHCADESLVHQ